MHQPLRVIISSTNLDLAVDKDIQSLAHALRRWRPGSIIQIVGLAQLPNLIQIVTPPPCDLLVLGTKGSPANAFLVEDLAKLAAAGCMVIGYPKSITRDVSLFKTAASQEQFLKVTSSQRCLHLPMQRIEQQALDPLVTNTSKNTAARSQSMPANQSSFSSRDAEIKRSEIYQSSEAERLRAQKRELPGGSQRQPIDSKDNSRKGDSFEIRHPMGSNSMKEYYPTHQQHSEAENAALKRPMSSASERSTSSGYRIRLESVRRISNSQRSGQDTMVFVLEGNGSLLEPLMRGLALRRPAIVLNDLRENTEFPPGCILIAPYELRRQIMVYLTARKPKMSCVLLGTDLLPDSVVNFPQLELLTHRPAQVQDYLMSKGALMALNPQFAMQQSYSSATRSIPNQGAPHYPSASPLPKPVKFIPEPQRPNQSQSPSSYANLPAGGTSPRGPEQLRSNKLEISPQQASLPKASVSSKIREWIVRKRPYSGDFILTSSNPEDQGSTGVRFPELHENGNLFKPPNKPPKPLTERPTSPISYDQSTNIAPAQKSNQMPSDSQYYSSYQPYSQQNSMYNHSMINSNPSLHIASKQSILNQRKNMQNNHYVQEYSQIESTPKRPVSRRVINLAEVQKSPEMANPDARIRSKHLIDSGKKPQQQRFTLTKANTAVLMRQANTIPATRPTSPPNNLSMSPHQEPNFSVLNEESNYYGSANSSSNAILIQQTSIRFKKNKKSSKEGADDELESSEQEHQLVTPKHNQIQDPEPPQTAPQQQLSDQAPIHNVDYKIPVGLPNPNMNVQSKEEGEEAKINTRINSPKTLNTVYYSPSNYIISEEINENQSLVLENDGIHSGGIIRSNTYRKARGATYENSDEKRTYKNSKPSRANILEDSHQDVSSLTSLQNEIRHNIGLPSPSASNESEPTPSSSDMKEMGISLAKMLPGSGLNSERINPRIDNGVNVYSLQNSRQSNSSGKKNSQIEKNSQELEKRKSPTPVGAESKHTDFPKNSYCSVSQSNPQSAVQYGLPPAQKKEQSPLAIHFTEKDSSFRLPVLYLLSKSLEELRPKVEALASDRDKIQVYSRSHELRKINYPDYSVVFLFPKEDEKLPETLEPNLYIIHLVGPEKQHISRELFVRDVRQLSGLIGSVVDPPNNRNRHSSHVTANNCDWSRAEENIRKYSSRLKVLFPGSEIELEQGIYKKLMDKVVPVKYFDSTALVDRAKHFRKDRVAVIMVSSMLRSIRDIRLLSKNIKFIVLERNGRSISRQEDVKFAQDVPRVIHLLETFAEQPN